MQVSFQSNFSEQLWVSISFSGNDQLLIGNVYRSPSLDKFSSTNELCELFNIVNNIKPSYLLIVGDFNYTNIDWDNNCLIRSDQSEQLFLDTIQDCVLSQHVMQPTRFRVDHEPHILDLIFTNEKDMVHQISYSAGLGSSDHVCIHFTLTCSPSVMPKTRTGYNYCRADFDKLRRILEETDWDTQLRDLDVYETWNMISKVLENAIEVCIPKIQYYSKKNTNI